MITPSEQPAPNLPSADELREAIAIFLAIAYPQGEPAIVVDCYRPVGAFDPVAWLMRECVERTPPDAPIEVVRSFAIRLGNYFYPHMKLRISRPPRESSCLFTVDSHDAFLKAPPGSADFEALEQVKRQNNEMVSRINDAWDAAGLPTERNYLRLKIQQAKDRGAQGRSPDQPPQPCR